MNTKIYFSLNYMTVIIIAVTHFAIRGKMKKKRETRNAIAPSRLKIVNPNQLSRHVVRCAASKSYSWQQLQPLPFAAVCFFSSSSAWALQAGFVIGVRKILSRRFCSFSCSIWSFRKMMDCISVSNNCFTPVKKFKFQN